jgi:PAS domain S-box-containing protein
MSGTLDLGNLRRRAEQRLRDREQGTSQEPLDLQRLVHELQVHQIELEMQNEELREARIELETALARYTELFDFAPIGYATISLDGTLHEINHTGARLLRRVRSDLLGRHLDAMVVPHDRPQFSELLRQIVESEVGETCELDLFRLDGRVIRVQLLANLLARAEPLVLLALKEVAAQSDSAAREPADAAANGGGLHSDRSAPALDSGAR